MCFHFEAGTKHVKKSEKDILVYKVMEPLRRRFLGIQLPWFFSTELLSPYMGHLYSHKLKQPVEKLEPIRRRISWRKEGEEVTDEVFAEEIHVGYHSFSKLKAAKKWRSIDTAVYEFIIPAGSEYYYNPFRDEYVSDNLILKSTIPLTSRK